jgi:5-hydroxyisourate hydrolase-like protein (transthyretin family)
MAPKDKDHFKGQKAGPWSKEDKAYIQKQAGRMLPDKIAENLRRNVDAVKGYMAKHGLLKYYNEKDVQVTENLSRIEDSQHWPILVSQFSYEELQSFKYHWRNMVKQFRDDILHTEELQIIDVIKLQLLIDRRLTETQKISQKISEIEAEIIKLKKAVPIDATKINDCEHELASWYASIEALSKDHVILLKEKQALFTKLKGTREQRIKEIESSKSTLTGWIKLLLTDPQKRVDLGIHMEKMRLATEVEYERLSEYHTFEDGTVDQMILNAETVTKCDGKKEKNQDMPKPEKGS